MIGGDPFIIFRASFTPWTSANQKLRWKRQREINFFHWTQVKRHESLKTDRWIFRSQNRRRWFVEGCFWSVTAATPSTALITLHCNDFIKILTWFLLSQKQVNQQGCCLKIKSLTKISHLWQHASRRTRPKKWPDGEMWKRERPSNGPRQGQGQGQGQGVPWGWCERNSYCQIHCCPMENPSRKVGLKSPFSFFVDICIFSSESIMSVLFTSEFILLLKIWFETNLSQNCRVLYPILSHPVRPKSS